MRNQQVRGRFVDLVFTALAVAASILLASSDRSKRSAGSSQRNDQAEEKKEASNDKRATADGLATWASAIAAVGSSIAAVVTLVYLSRQEVVLKNQVTAAYEAAVFQTQLDFLGRYLASSERVFYDLAFVHGALLHNQVIEETSKQLREDLNSLQLEYQKSGILIPQPLSIDAEALYFRIAGRDLLSIGRPPFEVKSDEFKCDAGYYQHIYLELSTCMKGVIRHFRPLSPETVTEFCKPLSWANKLENSHRYSDKAKEKEEFDGARADLKCPSNRIKVFGNDKSGQSRCNQVGLERDMSDDG